MFMSQNDAIHSAARRDSMVSLPGNARLRRAERMPGDASVTLSTIRFDMPQQITTTTSTDTPENGSYDYNAEKEGSNLILAV